MTMSQTGFPSEPLRDEHTRGVPNAFDRLERMLGSRSVLYMSMSLDGFITGPDDDAGQGLGRGGGRLHAWLGPGGDSPADPPVRAERRDLRRGARDRRGAGRAPHLRPAGHWDGDHHDGVPIFVPTRGQSPASPASDRVHYVTDGIESAMRQAKQAAGGANVLVHGADLAQSCLRAGVLDELEIHLIPILLGTGRPLFDDHPAELELTRVVDAPGVTHLHYEVKS